MSLEVKIDATELTRDLKNILDQFDSNVVVQAARRAINRSLIGVRQKSLDDLRKVFNVKERELRKRMSVTNASGGTLDTLFGTVNYSLESFPLIDFVKGSKAPAKQKGVAVKKRRKVKVEIIKGRVRTLQHAFIQQAKTKQVFKKGKSGGFKKQGTTAIGYMIEKRKLGDKFAAYGAKRFETEFMRELSVRAQGLVNSVDAGKRGRK